MNEVPGRMAARYGYWLAILEVVLGAAYLLGVAAIFMFDTFPPGEPYQSAVGAITLASAPGLVLLWVAIREMLPADKRIFGTGSLALMIIFGTLTSLNRYVSLTVVPQAIRQGQTEGLSWFQPYGWPSIMLAAEVLAWGLYLGLALLCLAPAFRSARSGRGIFWTLLVSGTLCLSGALGQVLNLAWLSMLGLLGWGPGLIVLMVLLARGFRAAAGGDRLDDGPQRSALGRRGAYADDPGRGGEGRGSAGEPCRAPVHRSLQEPIPEALSGARARPARRAGALDAGDRGGPAGREDHA